MSQLDTMCSRSEMILLYRLDLKSPLFFLLLPIRAYFAPILRDPGGAMLELRSALKILELRICGELLDLPFNLGVHCFSGWKSCGDIILSNIGCNPKRTFAAMTWRAEFHI